MLCAYGYIGVACFEHIHISIMQFSAHFCKTGLEVVHGAFYEDSIAAKQHTAQPWMKNEVGRSSCLEERSILFRYSEGNQNAVNVVVAASSCSVGERCE